MPLKLPCFPPLPHFFIDRKRFGRVLAEAAFQRTSMYLQRNLFVAAAVNKSIDEARREFFHIHLRILHHVNKLLEQQRVG